MALFTLCIFRVFMEIAASLSLSSAFIDNEGSYWYCGSKAQGLNASKTFYKPFAEILDLPRFTKCSSKYTHSLLLDEKQHVWSFGDNINGELGTGENSEKRGLTQITDLPKIRTMFAGYNNSFFISNEGEVFANGYNRNHELGLPNYDPKIPVKIEGIPPMQSVSAAQNHTLLLDCEGHVWSAGKNSHGQLGLGDNFITPLVFSKIGGIPEIRSVHAGLGFSVLLDFNGYMWAFGKSSTFPLSNSPSIVDPGIPDLPKVAIVEAGIKSILFVDEAGDTWAIGDNAHYQLGIRSEGAPVTVFTKVDGIMGITRNISTTHHTLFLDKNGTLLACGKNGQGELGLGDLSSREMPEVVPNIPKIGAPITHTKSARKVV